MKYDYQTVSRTMLGDLHTPVSTYLKCATFFLKAHSWRVPTIMAVKPTAHSSDFARSKRQYRPWCCRVLSARRHT